MRMGLPIERLVAATNANDIMARALNDGVYAAGAARATLSPSMDIQVASNFERALFEASGRDAEWVRGAMAAFAHARRLELPPKILSALRVRYGARAVDDDATLAAIAAVYSAHGRLIDPHTAVALSVAEQVRAGAKGPVVALSTAHPAKFPDAVKRATGKTPPLPPRLTGLYEGVERAQLLGHDLALVRDFIAQRSGFS
jgi:threonine synthase